MVEEEEEGEMVLEEEKEEWKRRRKRWCWKKGMRGGRGEGNGVVG